MAIDPSKFHPINVADTCSVWNVLSSARLHMAAKEAKCEFCITAFVRYECLVKPRKAPTAADIELRERLLREQARGGFQPHSCGIGDLQAIRVLESRKKLGKGELSSIAFAMKIGQAVLTDDQKARRLAESSGHLLTQTTPHLHSWLIFTGHLTDVDHTLVVSQHKAMEGSLEPHLQRAYELALQCRFNATRPVGQKSNVHLT
ncbi:hypothetical protein [Sulfuritalea sp.]|uniref:hypothetical protein n=1 Tax=Sulfuritalea sp. TaxID=2480090 RepID=UPI00286E8D1A|nr:hypothetical protein [Sulfuritalea sp.]